MRFMANEDNGLVKHKTTDGIRIRVKYLPIDYLVYNNIKNEEPALDKKGVDSVKKSYKNSLTFVLTLGPEEGKHFDITRVGVSNYEEFAQRIEEMSFHMHEYISLTINDLKYKPQLAQLESINTVEPSKNIIVVFDALDDNEESILTDDFTFTYIDELFYTGINNFKFNKSDVLALPTLNMLTHN